MSLRHAPYENGPGGFEIGLSPIEPDQWLEGGEAAPHLRKDALFAAAPGKVWGEMPGSRLAQGEAAALVAKASGGKLEPRFPPLLAAARLIADDLVLMERRGGEWTATAISLCAGTFFTADQALGRSLEALHAPAPGFGDRMLARTGRIFDHLPPDRILQRRNWTLVSDAALHLPDPAPMRETISAIDPARAGEALYVRVERQTLRRLPVSLGLLFTIRVWRDPLDALRTDSGRLASFAAAWRGADPAFRAYKQLHLYDDLVEGFLRDSGE